MSEQFLYERLTNAFEFGVPKPEMPDSITQNLHPKFEHASLSSGSVCKVSPLLKTITFPAREIRYNSCSTWQQAAVKRLSWQV